VKAIPILAATSMDRKFDWRGACSWGLASGIGFGIAEGIMYSASQYNGIAVADTYLVRFISCVALHATWTAAAAIMIWQNQAKLQTDTWYEWVLHLVLLVSVPMTLHGLYDTLLKRDLTPWALAVALASFGWLIFMIERARLGDVDANRRIARSYA
jgi:RsiW-degrading membrane proteinase PrsW (M82 family)